MDVYSTQSGLLSTMDVYPHMACHRLTSSLLVEFYSMFNR